MAEPVDPPGLRLAPLRGWLAEAGAPLDVDALVEPELFPSGRSNVTYLLSDARGARVVLRRPPLGNVMPTAHDMAREHRVLSGLARVGFPAPRPIALCEDERVIGAPFLLMEYVDGAILATEEDAASIAPADRAAASASLISTLAGLHRVDPAEAGLGELGRPQGFLPRQAARWAKQWEHTRTRDLPAMDELRARVSALLEKVPDDAASSLVHGDYRLDNVILSPDDWQARAVLDWEMSTLGDPLADVALLLVYWSQAADQLRHRIPIAESLTDGKGFWGRQQIIDAYQSEVDRPLGHLDACTALACYKLAVIAESIHARTLSGKQLGAASGSRGRMGEATEALAAMGLHVCDIGTVAGLES